MNLDKKIKKLVLLCSENYKNICNFGQVYSENSDEYKYIYKYIIKNFGSINYQKNGNTLLHLIVSSDYRFPIDQVYLAVCQLINLGVNPNIRNDDGQTFLEKSLKKYDENLLLKIFGGDYKIKGIDVNNTSKDGNTILHSLIFSYDDKAVYAKPLDRDVVFVNWGKYSDLLMKLLYNYDFDLTKRNDKGQSILDCVNYIIDKYQKDMQSAYYTIVDTYYTCNIKELWKLILDTDNEKLMEVLIKNFSNPSISLFICQTEKPKNHSDVETTLLCIKKLLEIGCNPKLNRCNQNFVVDAIFKGYPIEYILQISELGAQRGLDLSEGGGLVSGCLRMNMAINDLIDVYVVASKYGYDNLENLEYDLYKKGFIDGIIAYKNIFKYSYNKHDLYKYIRAEGFKIMFNVILKNHGFKNSVVFSDDVLYQILDTITQFKSIFDLGNDYHFSQLLCDFIRKKYNSYIMSIDTISEKEILVNMKEYLLNLFDNELKKTLIMKKEGDND